MIKQNKLIITLSIFIFSFHAINGWSVERLYDRQVGDIIDADKDDAEFDNTNNAINTHVDDLSAHGATGGVVGVNKEQTLTNKDFGGDVNFINGADLKFYSDNLTTLETSIDGATGEITLGVPLDEASGGTGNSSYAIGDLLYASTASVLSKLAGVVTGNVLISGGVATAPSWGKVGLTTHVSGTLPVASGGTGVTTSTGSGAVVLGTSPTITTPTITINDNSLTIRDNSDTTKVANLQLSGITTGTTRTYTLPDNSSTLVDLTETQTLTNKTLSGGTISGTIAGTPTISSVWTYSSAPLFNAGLSVGATDRVYFDNGNDTYISESSANNLRVTVGGTDLVDFGATSIDPSTDGVVTLGTSTKRFSNAWFDAGALIRFGNVGFNHSYIDGGIDSIILMGANGSAHRGMEVKYAEVIPTNDNVSSLGSSTNVWTEVWATDTSINTSDRNLKKNIKPSDLGLDFIEKLNPVSYLWKDRKNDITHYGLIAQEVEQALDGKSFNGLIKPKNKDENYALRYDDFIAPLIKSVQELSAKVDALEKKTQCQ